jgi:phosphoglycolate phosphatase
MTPRLVLFDLDGTLADTAPDIARVANQVLAEAHRPPLALETVRARVSFGARELLRGGFEHAVEDEKLDALLERLFAVYAEAPAVHTTVFPGLEAALAALGRADIRWGIVSNKPEALVRPIVMALALPGEPICVVGGDTFARKKPDPLPLVETCRRVNIPPAQTVYVGDSIIDAEAARAAGMPLIVAGFGYAPAQADLSDWGKVLYAADPRELSALLGLHTNTPLGAA